MPFKPAVERWRSIVQSEIDKARLPFPPEYPMSVIQRESGGRAGVVNPTRQDSGLMQVIPISLETYNNNHTVKYTMPQLQGKTNSSAAIQVRVGLWILQRYVRLAYRYLKPKLGNVPLDDMIKVADTFYASGPGNVKPKLNTLQRPTWDATKAKYPNWHRIAPAEKLWAMADGNGQWDLPAIDQWLEGNIIVEDKKTINGALIGILIILAAMMFFNKGKL